MVEDDLPNISLYGVTVKKCETDYGDYTVQFCPRDYSRNKVRKQIPNHHSRVHKKQYEGGELLVWFYEW